VKDRKDRKRKGDNNQLRQKNTSLKGHVGMLYKIVNTGEKTDTYG
jgi:hypothetical protein